MKASLALLLILICVPYLTQGMNCKSGCQNCTSFSTCEQCQYQYGYVNETGSCRPCPEGCSHCYFDADGWAVCQDCVTNFLLNDDDECFTCDPSCQTCEYVEYNCTSCHFGQELYFELDDDTGMQYGYCERNHDCQEDSCGMCANSSAHFCGECYPGEFLFDGICMPCKQKCGHCEFPTYHVYMYEVYYDIANIQLECMNHTMNYTMNYTMPNFTMPNYTMPNYTMPNFTMPNYTMPNGTRRLQEVLPPYETCLVNKDAVDMEDMQSLILHKFLFQLIEQETGQSGLEVSQKVDHIVNHQREIRDYPKSQRIEMMSYDLYDYADVDWEPQELEDELYHFLSNRTVCDGCEHGFKNNNGTCQRCPMDCLDCDDMLCYECESTTSLSMGNFSCLPCQYPCYECEDYDQTACLSCEPPYMLNSDGDCTMCDKPCQTCDYGMPHVCQKCLHPYSEYADQHGVCFMCDDFACLICDEMEPWICYECLDGLTVINNTCEVCPEKCSECDFYFGEDPICYECEDGYAVVDDSHCEPCGKGCKHCFFSEEDQQSICYECYEGLYVNESGKCRLCPQECQTCDEDQECLEYTEGKFLYEGQVIDCRPGCSDCSEDPEFCLECAERYFEEDGYCFKCQPGCLSCTTWDNCTQCDNGFVEQHGYCAECDDSCLECSENDTEVCTACKKGLALDDYGHCIHDCEFGCFECQAGNSTNCFECMEGYTLRASGACVKCLGSCSGYCDPKNITHCIECAYGFQLENNECVRCPEGCSECFEGSCDDCHLGFVMDYDIDEDLYFCERECLFPCSECAEDYLCEECVPGFVLEDGYCAPDISCNPDCNFCPAGTIRDNSTNICEECDEHCASCNYMECLECFSGYYLENGVCHHCSDNCMICADSVVCDYCEDGFLLEVIAQVGEIKYHDFFCTACDEKCLTCVEKPDICLSCADNRRLNGTKCFGRLVVGFEYQFDFDYEEFLEEIKCDELLQTIANILGINLDDLVINGISQGSTVVQGSVSTQNQAQAQQYSTALQNNEDQLGFSVLASSVGIYYDDAVYEDEEEEQQEEEEDVPVGLIVGVVVGVLVLAVIIGVVVYKYKKSKQTALQINDQSELNDQEPKREEALTNTQVYNLQNVKVIYS